MNASNSTAVRRADWRMAALVFVWLGTLAGATRASSFDIVIQPDFALAANADALAAVERAALAWESVFSDPITVVIDARFAALGTMVLGSADPATFDVTYDTLRTLMVMDADADDTLVASLQAVEPTVTLPAGFSLADKWTVTQANIKALGAPFSGVDGILRMSSDAPFDFDNSDGVDPLLYDFETIAIHEIGHILGFLTGVSDVDSRLNANQPGEVAAYGMDLLRFANDVPGADPETPADFASFPRSLLTGGDAITDLISAEYRMSTGVSTGDGRQASHWKANETTGVLIGVMDPTFARQEVVPITAADLAMLDFLGYDHVVPEPTGLLLAIAAVLCLALGRRR